LQEKLHKLTGHTYDWFCDDDTTTEELESFLKKNDILAIITDIKTQQEKLTTYATDYGKNQTLMNNTQGQINTNEGLLSEKR
jgi:hypothetical protein